MTKVVVLKPNEFQKKPELVGSWLNENHYHTLVEEDFDLYLPPNCNDSNILYDKSNCEKDFDCSGCTKGLNEKNIVFKFRKNYFSKEEVEGAYEGLHKVAVETENRKTASGSTMDSPFVNNRKRVTRRQTEIINFFINKNTKTIFSDNLAQTEIEQINKKYKDGEIYQGNVWLNRKLEDFKNTHGYDFDFDVFVEHLTQIDPKEAKKEAKRIRDTFIGDTEYNNKVLSGICGWYDRYPRIPFGRPTVYTEKHFDTFKKSYPFLQKLAIGFKELLPWRYENQNYAARQIDPKFLVPGTPFSTITVNKNFRTAAHYDPANMEDGFANLCVISKYDNYSGCYLVFPEIGYAVNIRPGDLLLVNNQAGLHGNTPLILHDDKAERVSIIAFFHEGMLELGSYEYEDTRRNFVEHRRLNPDHPAQKHLWNGITPGMWESNEWYEYLENKLGKEILHKYHPSTNQENTINLDNFF